MTPKPWKAFPGTALIRWAHIALGCFAIFLLLHWVSRLFSEQVFCAICLGSIALSFAAALALYAACLCIWLFTRK